MSGGKIGPYYLLEEGEIKEVRQKRVGRNPEMGDTSIEIINSLIDITATYALATQSTLED